MMASVVFAAALYQASAIDGKEKKEKASADEYGCVHSACTEYGPGKLDNDCCAVTSDGGCTAGHHYFSGSVCWNPNGAQQTCCMPDTCNAQVCLENGHPDSDCCGLSEVTACEPPYVKQEGDICWNANGARRVCCVLPDPDPMCEHSACTENGNRDGDCCALSSDGGCDPGFTYFTGSVCYSGNGAKQTCCMPEETCSPSACLENGRHDSDCCGLEDQTSCATGFFKTTGDICWNPNGARRTCCTREHGASESVSASFLQELPDVSTTGNTSKSAAVLLGIVPVFVLVSALVLVVKKKRQSVKNQDDTNSDKYVSLNQ